MAGVEVQISVRVGWLSVDCYRYVFTLGLGASQVTREAKEAIHIRRLDPSLNRNIGKMSIPHCFDNLLGAKPKHPRVGELSATPLPVEEVAPTASNTRPKSDPIQQYWEF